MLELKRHFFIPLLAIGCLFLFSACTSMQVNHSHPVILHSNQSIAVLPFTNMTETPQADERAAAMLANLLRTKGLMYVGRYPTYATKPSLIPGVRPPIRHARLLAWARDRGFCFAFTGSVSEWNYKVGLDGEPAVGIDLELIDVKSGQVIWSAVGSKSGGSRTALSEVGINLTNAMLRSIKVVR